jgi:hypothetical protein
MTPIMSISLSQISGSDLEYDGKEEIKASEKRKEELYQKIRLEI